MKLIDGLRYLDMHEMQSAGISYARLIAAHQRGCNGYSFLKDPADRRRLLVCYDNLKPSLKRLVDSKLGEEVASTKETAWVEVAAENARLRSIVAKQRERIKRLTARFNESHHTVRSIGNRP